MKIVYFDGYCNVCNRYIDFLIRHDSKHQLKFAPLQGHTAETRLPRTLTEQVATMAFEEDGIIQIESSAAIRSVAALGGIYASMKIFFIVPRFMRDPVYRFIATHRYMLFGKRDTCRLPSAIERAQFLD